MGRLAELEELARIARAQALLTNHYETARALHEMANEYVRAANERRSALADEDGTMQTGITF